MPIVYRCSRCGYILHIFVRVGQNSYGVPTPAELANQYGGLCPACNHPLNTKPSIDDVFIDPNGMRRLAETIVEARKTMRIRFHSVLKYLPQDLVSSILSDEEAVV